MTRRRKLVGLAASVVVLGAGFALLGEPSHERLFRMAEFTGLKARPPSSILLKGCGLLLRTDPDELRRSGTTISLQDDKSLFERSNDGGEGVPVTCDRKPARQIDRLAKRAAASIESSEVASSPIPLGQVPGIAARFQPFLKDRVQASCCMQTTDSFEFSGYHYTIRHELNGLPRYVRSIEFVP